jgi:predicted ArsR family transcriptional regulator
MAIRVDQPAFDGTTGRGEHGGRRTHIIKILRDAREPLTVEQVSKRVGIPVNSARFHLESLVDAGMALREVQSRTTPGRPKVAYLGTLPDQAHERAQGYRLLAELMAAAVAQLNADAGEWMYRVGAEWGRYLVGRGAPAPAHDEAEIAERLADKLDALWFSPELLKGSPSRIALHNCPFADSACRYPQVVCQLHAGMINGAMEEMQSGMRVTHLRALEPGHKCEAELSRTTARCTRVPLEVGPRTRSVQQS